MRRCRTRPQSPPAPGDIQGPEDALAVILHALSAPGIVAVLLNRSLGQGTVVVVDDAPDAGLEHIVALLLETAAESPVRELVLASTRPEPMGAVPLQDVDRWVALDAQVQRAGIVLLDWFILAGDLAYSMAEISFSDDRW